MQCQNIMPQTFAWAFQGAAHLPFRFLDVMVKYNKAGRAQDRAILCTATHLYSCLPDEGDVQRCVALQAIEDVRVCRRDRKVAIIVPSEYDFLLQASTTESLEQLLFQFPSSVAFTEVDVAPSHQSLKLEKPSGFQRKAAAPFTVVYPPRKVEQLRESRLRRRLELEERPAAGSGVVRGASDAAGTPKVGNLSGLGTPGMGTGSLMLPHMGSQVKPPRLTKGGAASPERMAAGAEPTLVEDTSGQPVVLPRQWQVVNSEALPSQALSEAAPVPGEDSPTRGSQAGNASFRNRRLDPLSPQVSFGGGMLEMERDDSDVMEMSHANDETTSNTSMSSTLRRSGAAAAANNNSGVLVADVAEDPTMTPPQPSSRGADVTPGSSRTPSNRQPVDVSALANQQQEQIRELAVAVVIERRRNAAMKEQFAETMAAERERASMLTAIVDDLRAEVERLSLENAQLKRPLPSL